MLASADRVKEIAAKRYIYRNRCNVLDLETGLDLTQLGMIIVGFSNVLGH